MFSPILVRQPPSLCGSLPVPAQRPKLHFISPPSPLFSFLFANFMCKATAEHSWCVRFGGYGVITDSCTQLSCITVFNSLPTATSNISIIFFSALPARDTVSSLDFSKPSRTSTLRFRWAIPTARTHRIRHAGRIF